MYYVRKAKPEENKTQKKKQKKKEKTKHKLFTYFLYYITAAKLYILINMYSTYIYIVYIFRVIFSLDSTPPVVRRIIPKNYIICTLCVAIILCVL